MTPEATPSTNGDPSVDDTTKSAQDQLATIAGFVASAKASAATAADHQAQIAAVLSDGQPDVLDAQLLQSNGKVLDSRTKQPAVIDFAWAFWRVVTCKHRNHFEQLPEAQVGIDLIEFPKGRLRFCAQLKSKGRM